MGVALMTVAGGGIHLITGFSSLEELMQTNSGCGVVWLWSCVVVEYALRWAVSEVSKL